MSAIHTDREKNSSGLVVERDELRRQLESMSAERDELRRQLESMSAGRDELRRQLERVTAEKNELETRAEDFVSYYSSKKKKEPSAQ